MRPGLLAGCADDPDSTLPTTGVASPETEACLNFRPSRRRGFSHLISYSRLMCFFL